MKFIDVIGHAVGIECLEAARITDQRLLEMLPIDVRHHCRL